MSWEGESIVGALKAAVADANGERTGLRRRQVAGPARTLPHVIRREPEAALRALARSLSETRRATE
ncbi:MAG: hypothetical protein FJX68_10550 [Alphaproteobacteria bacterium]|nr:hypothetical protein [Alphaproteobacteria bacterium]